MHEELFHSPDRPFRATPDVKFYFPHDSIEAARQSILRAVMRAEGPVMVLGGAGLGKSLLAMVVSEELSARFDVVRLHAARLCSRRALLQNILFELHLPYRDLSEGDLRLSILDRLEPSSNHAPDGILVIVDEAHTLPAKLLDELRLITNFTRNNQPRVRLVLIGSLRLEHTFAEPQMESFNQRLAARCYLQPMTRQQTKDYVRHQLKVAGLKPSELITDDAINTIYAASEGVPRLSNQIMDHALALAITRSQCPVSSSLIEEAWADLQQLPAPWHQGTEKASGASNQPIASASTIEFGLLEDEPELTFAETTPEHCQLAFESAPESAEAVRRHFEADEPSPSQKLPVESVSPPAIASADDELQLAEEPQDVVQSPRMSNFFAAFTPPDSELGNEFDDSESPVVSLVNSTKREQDQLLENSPKDHLEESEPLVRPHVAFDAGREYAIERLNSPQTAEPDTDADEALPIDSFFADRPTDEQLLALEAEQQQYDSMGLWENDPPLASPAPQPTAEPSLQNADVKPISSLFGDDFEEEVNVKATDSLFSPVRLGGSKLAWKESSPAYTNEAESDEETDVYIELSASASAQQAAEAADYVARIQEFSDALLMTNQHLPGQPVPTVDEVLNDRLAAELPNSQNILVSDDAALDMWSVDVTSVELDEEIAVHDEIEDLVSQLNFAAFSVEPFSVEQIPLEPRDQSSRPPADSVRSGANDEVYSMHRPQIMSDQQVFNGWNANEQAAYDDDRDLLIVEEDLPVSAKAADESQKPATKIAPYSQLFSQLRK